MARDKLATSNSGEMSQIKKKQASSKPTNLFFIGHLERLALYVYAGGDEFRRAGIGRLSVVGLWWGRGSWKHFLRHNEGYLVTATQMPSLTHLLIRFIRLLHFLAISVTNPSRVVCDLVPC